MLETLLSPQEISEMQTKLGTSRVEDHERLSYLIREGIVLMVDWTGESEKYETGTFLQRRLDRLGDGQPLLEQDDVYKEMEKREIVDRGDAVPLLLEYFEKKIKKWGFSISLLQSGQDAYYIVLSSSGNAKKLRKHKSDYWKFTAFDAGRGEVLYTVDCPDCGGQAIWQLKRGSPPPSDERCEDCGRPLFDEKGNALAEVTIDYI